MDGSENDVESTRPFAATLFQLLAADARTIIGAHHAPKGFEGVDRPTLETVLRGSSDLGAMVATCWALRQVDEERNQIFIQNVKARDFQACGPFVIEGRPYLDETGNFKMLEPPGTARSLRSYLERDKDQGGRPMLPRKEEKTRQAVEMRAQGRSLRETAQALNVSKSSIERLLFDYDLSQKCPSGTEVLGQKEPGPEAGRGKYPKDTPPPGLVV